MIGIKKVAMSSTTFLSEQPSLLKSMMLQNNIFVHAIQIDKNVEHALKQKRVSLIMFVDKIRTSTLAGCTVYPSF
jgi:hypothetical protein